MPLDEDTIAARFADLTKVNEAAADRLQADWPAQAERAQSYQYVRPLTATYDTVIDAMQNPERRFKFGLDAIDTRTRGLGAKELMLVTGFAHAGKTQLVNTAIMHNQDRRILFFSMDDPSEMILIKLVCMVNNVDAETLEKRIKNDDERTKRALMEAATHTFKNLVIVDDSLSLADMDVAIAEATDWWGGLPPEVVIIDFVGSMASDDVDDLDGIKSKMAQIKRWVKDKDFGVIALHQNTRSNGGPGKPITLLSGGYGGEQEATMVLGVRRKRDDVDLDGFVRAAEENTVTLHLVKNKRPPGKKTAPEGIDFFMEPATGIIRPLAESDAPARTVGLSTAKEGFLAREAATNGESPT